MAEVYPAHREIKVFGRAGKELLPADNVGDSHFGVIDNVRKLYVGKPSDFTNIKSSITSWAGVHFAHDFVVPGISFRL